MIRRNPVMTAIAFLAIVALFDLALLISGYRILVRENRGEAWSEGNLEVRSVKLGETLTCTYFTGRSVRTMTAGPDGFIPDECPFVTRAPREGAFDLD
ncbi:MAG: hypothetical protein BGP16_18085 [Sphingobium sp. 66-54]|nr:MAG: hypothetical protein BGP16_18085 [Sphingobium sp. 66-54]